VVNAMRAMALGGPLEPTLWPNLWRSMIWLAGIFVVFLPLAVRAYRRAALLPGQLHDATPLCPLCLNLALRHFGRRP
jgi:hypothetical protein